VPSNHPRHAPKSATLSGKKYKNNPFDISKREKPTLLQQSTQNFNALRPRNVSSGEGKDP
jgi:hypothetical protein